MTETAELIVLKSINNKLQEIIDIFQIKGVVQANLADFSKAPKAKTSYTKEMPEMIGGYTISKKGCNRCGGKITWDLYDKDGGHPYPDHVDEDGNIIDCPAYNK